LINSIISITFSALTLLDGQQEEHLVCKNVSYEGMAWLSVGSKVQMISTWYKLHHHLLLH